MAYDPDEDLPRPAKKEIVLCEDVSRLSVVELETLIMTLEAEITRMRAALKDRSATKNAADAVFKR